MAGKRQSGDDREPRARRWGRREVLRTLGGLAAGGAGAGIAGAEPDPVPSATRIQGAEWLSGMSFTPDERELMREDMEETLEGFEAIRAVPLDNGVAPSIGFDPRPPAPPEATGGPGIVGPAPVTGLPGSSEDIAFAGLGDIAAWLAGGALTSEELTQLYLDRMEKWNPDLACVVQNTAELALETARKADEARRQGQVAGPLHGIPWGAKDLIAVEGTRTTWGARPYADQIRNETATVATRLFSHHAPLLAKLSVGALAWGDVWFGGTTKNPWNLEQGSSGSSAGPAAATAAGLCGFSIGTETWGSIISPSTRCGVTGLRPTYGRVSKSGVMALSWTMDKVGPICRRVEDCAWVFAAIQGPDGLDASVRPGSPFVWPPRDRRKIRVGFLPSLFDEDRTQGIENESDRIAARDWMKNDLAVLEVLRRVGWELVPLTLPTDLPIGPLGIILTAEATTAFDELTRSGRDDELTRQERYAWPNVFRQGQLIPAVEYLRANRIRTLLRAEMERLFETVDVFVAPSFAGNHMLMTNLTGHPALCVPNGFRSGDGTPTSITFTGRLFGESDLLAVGQAYQEATGFHLERPPLAESE